MVKIDLIDLESEEAFVVLRWQNNVSIRPVQFIKGTSKVAGFFYDQFFVFERAAKLAAKSKLC